MTRSITFLPLDDPSKDPDSGYMRSTREMGERGNTPILRVRSRLFGGETVVCCEDDYDRPLPAGIVYRRAELERMRDLDPGQVLAIHQAKQLGDGGRYIGPSPERRRR